MKIFDSHAHYDDKRYESNREVLLNEIQNNGVSYIVNCGASFDGIKDSIRLSKEFSFLYAAIGIHPSNADEYNDEVEKYIIENLNNDKVLAIGEIGLDYYWDENPSKEVQMEVLNKQYNLARKYNMPVILHVRDAYGDMMDFLRKNNDVKAVLHSFSGSLEIARQVIDLGYYIGVGGVSTFKNSKKLPEIIKEIPVDRILTETDAPYLTPVPFRGKDNRSDYIKYVIEKISQFRETNIEDLWPTLYENNFKFFNLDK